MDAHEKLEVLKKNIKARGNLAVAFSGGVDSTFLIKVASQVLGKKAVAITARAVAFPSKEFEEAVAFTKEIGVQHIIIDADVFAFPHFSENPKERCYYCKKAIFGKIIEAAKMHDIDTIADGSNVDDDSDYRPGMKAIAELKVISPLKEVGLTKEEIRLLSKEMGLPTWDKQSSACLASRIPYGQPITKENLSMVERAENYLATLGFKQVRVRHHNDLARIEVGADEQSRFCESNLMQQVHAELKKIGYTFVALDMQGYRMGSMNEAILKDQ